MTETAPRHEVQFRVPLQDQPPTTELGAGRLIGPESIVRSLAIPQTGRTFDLDPGRFNGMPRDPLSPPFQLVTHRTPHGIRVESDIRELDASTNPAKTAWIDELIIGTIHCGAHIDALSHVTHGDDDSWFGGHTAADSLSDFGPLHGDAAQLPAIISRGVLLDVAAAHGLDELPPGPQIDPAELTETARLQKTTLQIGDVVLVRTGQMRRWPHGIDFDRPAAGVVPDGGEFLAARQPVAVGSDTSGFETRATPDGRPNEVHIQLLLQRGIYIMEWLYLEALSDARAFEFLFLALPLKIQGATGSWLRPVCIV